MSFYYYYYYYIKKMFWGGSFSFLYQRRLLFCRDFIVHMPKIHVYYNLLFLFFMLRYVYALSSRLHESEEQFLYSVTHTNKSLPGSSRA